MPTMNGAPCAQPSIPFAAPAAAPPKPKLTILELEPKIIHTPPGNRTPTVETTTDLLASMANIGQQVPGIVYPHERPGEWYAAAGNRRAFVCGLLGIPFKAVPVEGPVSEADVIKIRLTENVIRRAMHPLEIADDVTNYIRLTGATQGAAAAQLGLDEATISKAMGISRRICPDLRPLVENFSLVPSVAYQISRLPDHESQKDVASRYVAGHLKRDSVEAVVSQRLSGKKGKAKEKPVKARTARGLQVVIPALDFDTLLAEWKALGDAIKKAQLHGLPMSALSSLLKV
jgi:ParB/RepB/Spo0J family partition protein